MDNAFHHVPVLFDEVMQWMAPRPDGVYLDGTLGGGGHSEGILRLSGGTARLYGIDRDGEAIAAASARLGAYPGFRAIHGNFHDGKGAAWRGGRAAAHRRAGGPGREQPSARRGLARLQLP